MNVLAIGAHFDDIELGCGGAIAKHVATGDKVTMLVITHSAYNDWDGTIIRTKEIARNEGKKAAEKLGVKDLICLDYETKNVTYCTKLIEDINKIIDELKIDTIYTHWVHDTHQDHSATGRATINAARHVPRVLMYRSNWYAAPDYFKGRFYVDVTNVIDKKIESIKMHANEFKKYGQKWVDFVVHQNQNNGIEMETEYAEVFEIVRYLKDT